MKKLLFTAIAVMISLVAGAQQLKLQKNVGADDKGTARLQAPAKAAGIEGTDIWGYYTGTSTDAFGGLGTGSAGTFRVAIFVPGNEMLKGAKIRGINIPAISPMTKVSGWVSSGLTTGDYIASKDLASAKIGYNTLQFDEPIEITEKGAYVGYTFTSTAAYPIATTGTDTPGGLFLALSGTAALEDYSVTSNHFGVSPIQVYVEGMDLPEGSASIESVDFRAAVKGAETKVKVNFNTTSNDGINSIGYVLNVNGTEKTGTLEFNPSIGRGYKISHEAEVSFTAPDEIGSFPASIALTTVNGKANDDLNATRFNVNTVSRIVPRLTVVEELTGTGCGYCPRGWVGMEKVKNERSDKAAVIAWHRYNSTDPMYQANYAKGFSGAAPACMIDRKSGEIDPYYGNSSDILNDVDYYAEEVPFVDIYVEGKLNEANTQVYVKSETEFLTNAEGYKIAFALTADDLSGTTSTWKQSNYYYSDSPTSVPEDLAIFCRGGEYGKSSVALTFNDVLIGSSYNAAGTTLAPSFQTSEAGNVEITEYTISMPTKATLKAALKYDKLYITAIVTDRNGNIVNAKRARVLGYGETPDSPDDPSGPVVVEGAVLSPMNEETHLMGEAMSPNTKYVVGTNYVTYAPALWNVSTGEIKNYEVNEEGAFHGVNNSGLAVGDDGKYALAIKEDGTEIELFYEEGEIKHNDEFDFDYTTGDAGSAAWAVSEDGKVIAGCYYDTNYKTTPCIWNENGERTDLPIPSEEEVGTEIDGAQVRWMTPDASVLLGFVHDDFSTWPACIWTKNADGSYSVNLISKNYWEPSYQMGKPYMVFHPQGISENGEWVSLNVQAEYDGFDFSAVIPLEKAARLNLKSGKLEVLESDNVVYHAAGIANDGTVVMYTGEDMIGRSGFRWSDGQKVATIDETLTSTLATMTKDPEAGILTNTPCSITADGKIIQGFAMDNTEEVNIFSYVLVINPDTDAVENITITPIAKASDSIYNIAGQKLSNMNKRGLYIINGKKVMK